MFSAYTIGVKLALVDGASSALVGIAARFGTLHRDQLAATASLAAYEKRLKSIQAMGLIGGAMAGGGFVVLEQLRKPLEEASRFQTEVTRFAALRLGDKATTDAVKFAKGMDIMGQSARDNMILIRDATTIMGSLEHAKEAAPLLAKMRFGIEAVMGEGKGAGFETALQASLKVGELRGALVNKETGQVDVAKFAGTLNLMTQAYVASGGRVKPQDYLAAMKTGGVSTKMMSDEMFFFGLGHFMQEMGGNRTGTASMTLFNQIAQGVMSQHVAERMAKEGLLRPSAIHYGKTGHITKVDDLGVVGAKEFVANPFAWVNDTVIPRLIANGHKAGLDLDLALASVFGVRTAKGIVDAYHREAPIATQYVERAKKAANVDTLYSMAGETLQGKEIDLTAKWKSLMLELGDQVLPLAIKGVQWLTHEIKTLTAWTKENPELTKAIVLTGAAAAALVTVGGVALVATAGIRGLSLALSFSPLGGVAGLSKTATEMSAVGGSIKFLAGAVGMLGAAAAAYQVGQWAGKKAYDEAANDPLLRGLGKGIAYGLAFFGNEEAREALALDAKGTGLAVKAAPTLEWMRATSPVAAAAYSSAAKPDLSFLAPIATGKEMPRLDWMRATLAPPAGAATIPSTDPFASYLRTAPAPTMVQVQSKISIDGRQVVNAVDDHVGRSMNGAGMGSTQFDPSFSVPPIALPATK